MGSSVRILFWYLSFFFFSSRRRHTRLQGDWSSDVCSSDLTCRPGATFLCPGVPVRGSIAPVAERRRSVLKSRAILRVDGPEAAVWSTSWGVWVPWESESQRPESQSPCNSESRFFLEKKKK